MPYDDFHSRVIKVPVRRTSTYAVAKNTVGTHDKVFDFQNVQRPGRVGSGHRVIDFWVGSGQVPSLCQTVGLTLSRSDPTRPKVLTRRVDDL